MLTSDISRPLFLCVTSHALSPRTAVTLWLCIIREPNTPWALSLYCPPTGEREAELSRTKRRRLDIPPRTRGRLKPAPSAHRPKLLNGRPYPEPNRLTYGSFTRHQITFDSTPTTAPSSSPYFPTPPPTECARYGPNLGLTSFESFARCASIPTQPAGFRRPRHHSHYKDDVRLGRYIRTKLAMRVSKGGEFAKTPNTFPRAKTRGTSFDRGLSPFNRHPLPGNTISAAEFIRYSPPDAVASFRSAQ